MALIDKIKLDGTTYDIASPVGYGTCATAGDVAAKVVTISNTDWVLQVGSIIGVKFTNTNSASSVTLNVNGTGAKSIYYNNAAYTSTSSSICGYASRVIYYMYDGTYWVWLNMGTLDGNTDTKVQQNAAITTSGEYPVVLAYSTATSKVTNAVNKAAGFTYNPSTKLLTQGATPAAGDNSTKVATTAFVQTAVADRAPMYTYGTADLVAGETNLAAGRLHFIYE